MGRKILNRIIAWLYRLAYEKVTLDGVNQKLIRPVPGLIIDGRQYWEFVNIVDMPESRRVNYLNVRRRMAMNLDDELVMKYIDKLKEANQENNVNRIGSLLYMLEDTLKTITPIENYYYMASIAYFDAREDIKTYDLDYNNEKIRKFKALPDQSFFLTRLFSENLNKGGEQSAEHILASLKRDEVKLKAFSRILGK